jgi:hypothetical protein
MTRLGIAALGCLVERSSKFFATQPCGALLPEQPKAAVPTWFICDYNIRDVE